MPEVIYDSLSLKRFLRLPEAKPALEYIDGKVIQKVEPKQVHSVLQSGLGATLHNHVSLHRSGRTYIELRCAYGGNSYVHDLCVIAFERVPSNPDGSLADDVPIPPDLAVEIMSPGQTLRAMTARMRRCTRDGVGLAWLVQPRKRQIHVFQPAQPPVTLTEDKILTAEPLLPGFQLPLSTIFGWIDAA